MLVGVSLKMYFSHARTVGWMREVAAHPPGEGVEAFVIPQFPSIPACLELGAPAGIRVGAQDVATEDEGAFTGEVSARVIAELGCRYAEVGHAERRRLFGETDEIVAAKTLAALRNGLVPIVCVGETSRVGPAEAAAACIRQIDSALAPARAAGRGGDIVVAYEPVWAIGAPEPADDAHIRAVCGTLRAELAAAGVTASVIYGGSAGPGLLTRIRGDVDGIFLGRFAHDPGAVRGIFDEAARLAA